MTVRIFRMTVRIFHMTVKIFRVTVRYLIKKFAVAMKRATVILINVKSCNALLRMLLLCIYSYLQSVLTYTFLILDTHHPDNMFT